ncbi:MAG: [protein-PII] uridylyltransferase, partial [Candidatus Binatia bacterium]
MDTVALSRELLEESQKHVLRLESEGILRPGSGRADLIRLSRDYIQKGRARLLEIHRAGAAGMEVVSAYSGMVDHLICYLYDVATEEASRRFAGQKPNCAVVAQGGYGRGELNPQSDIDLLFLYPWKVTPVIESVTEKILYTLWDAGLQVGNAVRNIGETMRLAEADIKVKTALLETRFLCGDYALYQEFEIAVEKRLVKKHVGRFIREKLEETRARHAGFGGSVYLLEPDVKEGQGGLRDIHTARWIARATQGAKSFDELARNGIVNAADVAKLKEAQDFLLRVRNQLHFSTGKHQDQLTFEEREKAAAALGFAGEGTLKAVEVFLRAYYLHAAEVQRLSTLIVHRLHDCSRPFFSGHAVFSRTVREGVRLSRGHLTVTKPEILRAAPGNLIRVFADAQQNRCELSHETREAVRENLNLIDENFRRSAEANLPFFEILKWKERVYETLAEMHACGVLGAFIPEFGRLLCMALHDAYHIYTVDQHSLRLVKEIERLKAGEYTEALPLLTQLAREADKIELLYLGLMFHDIGKGFGGGHSEIGARLLRPIVRRMRLNVDDGALVEFLVRYHLLMTNTAFRRDLEDPKTIFDFARTVGTVKNLKMLYLLTFADVKGVGPEVWNAWKASLVGELYVKTLNILEEFEKGEFERPDLKAAVRRVQVRMRRDLAKDQPLERVNHFLDTMPDRYFLSVSEADMPAQFALMEQFAGEGAVSFVEHFPERYCSSLVVCTQDRPGLFAAITGVLTALNLNIVNARIFTSSDGRILDIFRISHAGRPETTMAETKWSKFRDNLNEVLSGEIDVSRLVAASQQGTLLQKRAPKVSTVVQIDNEASEQFNIVEVFTDDRIGVLFNIAHELHQLGLSIHVAKISTSVDQVADVFYVADQGGVKVTDADRLEQIKITLYQRLAPQHEGHAQPA